MKLLIMLLTFTTLWAVPQVKWLHAGYGQYFGHWADQVENPLLWKERTEVTADNVSQAPKTLRNVYFGGLIYWNKSLFSDLKSGYHWNSVEEHFQNPITVSPTTVNGWEDLEATIGYKYSSFSFRLHGFFPLQKTKNAGSFSSTPWSGFGAWRTGLSLEWGHQQHWTQVQTNIVVGDKDGALVKSGDWESKILYFYSVPLSSQFKLQPGVITSYLDYTWTSVRQREFQIEPHLSLAYAPVWHSEFKLDIAATAYSVAHSAPTEPSKPSLFVDATRQIIFSFTFNKYF